MCLFLSVYRLRTFGKTLAAVATLGTGNSLGPEGPAVELGVASSRYVSSIANLSVQRQRMLLGAGAAAGVAAGFNAPIAGIFFSLEIVKVGLLVCALSLEQDPAFHNSSNIRFGCPPLRVDHTRTFALGWIYGPRCLFFFCFTVSRTAVSRTP